MLERCFFCGEEIDTLDDLAIRTPKLKRAVCVRCLESDKPGEPRLVPSAERSAREAAGKATNI